MSVRILRSVRFGGVRTTFVRSLRSGDNIVPVQLDLALTSLVLPSPSRFLMITCGGGGGIKSLMGTIGIFLTLFLAFARFFPVLALNELKTILKSSGESYKNEQAK